MIHNISFVRASKNIAKGIAVLLTDKNGTLEELKNNLNPQAENRLLKRLKASDFYSDSKLCEILYVGDVMTCEWLIIAKEPQRPSEKALLELGSSIYKAATSLQTKKSKQLAITLYAHKKHNNDYQNMLCLTILGFALRSYSFDIYKTPEQPISIEFRISCANPQKVQTRWQHYQAIRSGIDFTRDLVTEPPNVLYPQSFAERLVELRDIGIELEIKDRKTLEKEGWGALLGVAQGSEKEARAVILRWQGSKSEEAPLAFIGKGVTFDTGGISLKPANGMEDMKFDMGGAASVVGLMKTLALRKATVNVVAAVGLVENMPSGTAIRPSDVLTSLSGKTIEVLNTDAEGRLVLADLLWHIQDTYNPQVMINLATLTGAIMVALGSLYAGMFSNNNTLARKLETASRTTGERIWRMPLDPDFAQELKSPIADVKNIGKRWGGAITAAQFLEHFVNKTPWVHLDIAGVAWNNDEHKITGKGASGFGVLLLNALVESYENK